MERTPYIDNALPLITARIEWRLFTSRPLPSITARLARDEILQIIGEEPTTMRPDRPLDDTPVHTRPARGNTDGAGSAVESAEERPADRERESAGGSRVESAAEEPANREQEPAGGNDGNPGGAGSRAGSAEEESGERGGWNRADSKYRKPPGQPNRPLSGGYSLEGHLLRKCEWTREDFKNVQAMVHQLAAQKLDTTSSYRKQNKHTVQSICEQVKLTHRITRGYDDSWVIKDMLIIHLKNTSETERKRNNRNPS
ncbi:hypothetical protein C8R47DRAFT_1212765 [Mycena vitilis]|nr:hypothetical protein C8R47DRAFT_1212742 [Mycena vitilis]KAJ6497228.1 hypothetical protein C8R47DRAFT_1212765 [Mycena vitilis]